MLIEAVTGTLGRRWILILMAAALSHGLEWGDPDRFEGLRHRLSDPLFTHHFRPDPADSHTPSRLVHVDANYYLNRSIHGQVIRRLTTLGAGPLVIDHVFDGPGDGVEDEALARAVESSGRVILGVEPDLVPSDHGLRETVESRPPVSWTLDVRGDTDNLPAGRTLRTPYASIAAEAGGYGFVNLIADPDGILRRVPLVVRSGDTYVPSLALRAVCEAEGVSLDRVVVDLGRAVRLSDASGRLQRRIPIDRRGRVILDVGRWPESLRHISYSEILETEGDPGLAGSVAIFSETGGQPIRVLRGPGPDIMSTGVIHGALIHAILSNTVVKPAPWAFTPLIELALLGAVFLLSFRSSTPVFAVGALAVGIGYIGIATMALWAFRLLLPVVIPIVSVILSTGAIVGMITIEKAALYARNERARRAAEGELEIGRRIQKGFLPSVLPNIEGWEMAVLFEPARQVSGDFYDVFPMAGGKRYGLVIADICDKGVGAALFMAIFRSLIRVLSGADGGLAAPGDSSGLSSDTLLLRTVTTVNHYIAVTHGEEGMFATLFFGVLDPSSGKLVYVNGGHEPPVVTGRGVVKDRLRPTGPAVGAFSDARFRSAETVLLPGDGLIGLTDGVVDAVNGDGAPFGSERLEAFIGSASTSAGGQIAGLQDALKRHVGTCPPTDDITCIAVRRVGD